MRSAHPRSRAGGGAASIPSVAVLGVAACASVVVLLLAAVSPTLLVLAIFALAGASVLLLSTYPLRLLLCGYAFSSPIAISKAVATGAGVYAPALEITVADLFVAAIAVFVLGEVVFGNRGTMAGAGERTRVPGLPAVVIFFAWAWVSALHATELSHGLLAALNLSKYFVGFLFVARLVRTADDVRWVLSALALGLAVQVAVVGLQFVAGSSLLLPGIKTTSAATMGYNLSYAGGVAAFRPSGLLQHPVFLAGYLVVVLPTPVALMLVGPRALGRRPWLLSAALALGGAVALVLTLSRGGWLSFVVAVAFVMVAGAALRLVSRLQLVLALVLALATGGAVVAAYPQVLHRVTDGDDRSAESRMLMVEQAWSIVQRNAMLGVGMASYVDAAQTVRPPSYATLPPDFRETLSSGVVHNAYLVFWAERGVVGLLTALLVFGWYVRAFLRQRSWGDPVWHALGLGITAGLVGQLAMYNFDHGYLDSRPGVIWMTFGLLAAILRMQPAPGEAPAVEGGR